MSAALLPAAVPATKAALEELLRARRLQAEAPPLRGEVRRAPLATGLAAIDTALGGGLRRGQVSEIHGPASSGRTGLALTLAAGVTRRGALAAWVDPADRLDPASAAAAGIDLARLLWLRGLRGRAAPPRPLADAVAATGTLVGSGLFDLVVLDFLASERELQRLPLTTWTRLERGVEDTQTALLLLFGAHVAHGPGGASLALSPRGPSFTGAPGVGHLLQALSAEVAVGRHATRRAVLKLSAHC
jgi:recA bacterial DNA recombination protein